VTGGDVVNNKMAKQISMRDAYWNKVYDLAKQDRNVVLVSADMGAPALDKFRKNLGSQQYINCGIAEHSMIATAAGLAKEGKKVFTYAIGPFITSRCHEFTKLNGALMGIPINLVGVGAGFGYEDSGPTHHMTEDISIMRALPNIEIYSPSDSNVAAGIAQTVYDSPNATYTRLDREVMPDLYSSNQRFNRGYVLTEGDKKESGVIISTGNMVHQAMKIRENLGREIPVIDLFRIKPINKELLLEDLSEYDKAVTIEEHILDGGLGSTIAEFVVDNDLDLRMKRLGLKDYIYAYGGRENVRKEAGIGLEQLTEEVRKFL
jgi:transketolase